LDHGVEANQRNRCGSSHPDHAGDEGPLGTIISTAFTGSLRRVASSEILKLL
jgi:hypothetical protein